LISDRAAYSYLPQSTAYLPPPAELKTMLSAAGFLEVDREVLLLGSAQILTGVRGPLTPVGIRPQGVPSE
jgi:demethylmenaquinone methyltransferase/2-methoxy-6-polyprenyl-1,4-benzoquinol methylase